MSRFFHSSFLSSIRCILFTTFILLVFTIAANAREVTLQWDPNSEPDLSHYVVYWGSSSGTYSTNSGDIGLVTSYSCTLPDDGQIYYFAVTAVDTMGLESDYSNEVLTDGTITEPEIPTTVPSKIIGVDIQIVLLFIFNKGELIC